MKRAFLVRRDILDLRVRKVIGDLLVSAPVLLVLLALEASLDYKEKKVIPVLRERQVHQGGWSKGRKGKGG